MQYLKAAVDKVNLQIHGFKNIVELKSLICCSYNKSLGNWVKSATVLREAIKSLKILAEVPGWTGFGPEQQNALGDIFSQRREPLAGLGRKYSTRKVISCSDNQLFRDNTVVVEQVRVWKRQQQVYREWTRSLRCQSTNRRL